MKIKIIPVLLLMFFATETFSQVNREVEKGIVALESISKKICSKLDTLNDMEALSKDEVLLLINEPIRNSEIFSKTEFNEIPSDRIIEFLKQTLLIECEKYWLLDAILEKDAYYADQPYYSENQKKQYYIAREFLVAALKTSNVDSLKQYFNPHLDKDLLEKSIEELIKEISTYKGELILHTSAPPKSMITYGSYLDFKTGDSVFSINFQFSGYNDFLIDFWIFEPYEKSDDLDELMKDIPPPPPINKKGN